MALTRPIDQPEPDASGIPPQNGDAGPVTPIAAGEAGRVTPMMEQYQDIKAVHPDCLLFYRMGDFYELFFADAEIASRALGIVLTKRGKHLGADIPMCGVPIERADDYLHRLIAQGHRVAVCEQLEDPAEARKRGAKSVVRRDVVRLVTPGTLTEDSLLDAKRNNYLLAVARARLSGDDSRFALAWIDISTGEFRVSECDRATLSAEIARLEPGEIIVSDALYGEPDLAAFWRSLPAVTPLARDVFDGATAERRLTSFFAVSTSEAFGAMTRLEITAAAACVTYVERTQIGQRPPMSPPLRESAGASMAIDQATRGNLELMRTLSGDRRGSLLDAIDRTVTAAGSRLLAQRLSAPLTDPAQIARRLELGRKLCGRCGGARGSPLPPARRTGSCPLVVAIGRWPWRAARPCRHPRWHAGGRRPCPRACFAQGQARRDSRRDASLPQAGRHAGRRIVRRARRRTAGLQARRRLRPRSL